jgi:hypothetical protein
MATIFLSYRRQDTAGYAGRLADDLKERFGSASVFQDVVTIGPGTDFTQVIEEAVGSCRVLIALIGDTWATETAPDGSRRLHQANDFVRLEIASALRRSTAVMPVLVEGASMPTAEELPENLKPLARVQAIELSDSRWDYDVERLTQAIEGLTGAKARRRGLRLLRTPSKHLLAAGIATMVLGALIAVGSYLLRPGIPHLSGRWYLPNGNYWLVRQEGKTLTVEAVISETERVWQVGTAVLDGRRVIVRLEPTGTLRYRYRGELELSRDGRTLSGSLTTVPSEETYPLVLIRR